MTSGPWRILFMGTSPFACPSLKSLLEKAERIVGVFTQPDRPQGRGLQVRPSSVKAMAVESGLPVYQPEKIDQAQSFELLKQLAPDLIVVVAFGQILPQRILDTPRWGCINIHASLLPQYRGAAPINWAIIRGEKTTGVTSILMDSGLDTGDILIQRKTDILPDESAGELHDRLAQTGALVLTETIEKWKKGTLALRKQNESDSSYAPPLKKDDGIIDWGESAEKTYNQVRGMNPWPGACTFLKGKKLKIFRAQPILKDVHQEPGTVLETTNAGVLISTGKNCLLLTEIQLQSRKRIPAARFLQGNPIPVGTRLG